MEVHGRLFAVFTRSGVRRAAGSHDEPAFFIINSKLTHKINEYNIKTHVILIGGVIEWPSFSAKRFIKKRNGSSGRS